MSFLLAPRRKGPAPNSVARLDWEHPSALGLQDAFILGPSGTALINLTRLPVTATQGTLTRVSSQKGLALSFSSAAIQTAPPVIYTGGVTALAVVIPTTVDANGRSLIHRRNISTIGTSGTVGSNSSGAWVLNQSNTGIGWGGWTSTGTSAWNTGTSVILPVGTVSVVAATARGNGLATSIYLNGTKVGSSTQSGTLHNTTGFWTEIGGRTGNVSTRYFAGSILLSFHWWRGLDDAELASLTEDPWQLLEPRKIWVPVSAASGVTGTFASTTANDSLAAAGNTTVVGTLSRTLTSDTLTSAGSTTILGSLSRTLADDGLVATGAPGTAIAGSLAATLQGATLAATGTITQVATLAVTLADATLASVGTTTIVGSLSSTLADARLNSAGYPGLPPEGSFWRFLGVPLNRMGL
jgi:hypothetical protein